jgi:hypothetical protein
MLEASRRVLRYAGGATLEDVRGDEVLADAILHRLTVLGRAATRISPSLRAQNSDVPWQRIGELRELAASSPAGSWSTWSGTQSRRTYPGWCRAWRPWFRPSTTAREGHVRAFEATSSKSYNP